MKTIKATVINNKKVIENYFFMTVLQLLNSLFYLIIYPFLIRTLGAESYGLYVFSMSIVTYFISIVSFGFDFPAVKSIAQNQNNYEVKTYTLSCVFTAKLYLEVISVFVFSILIAAIPSLRNNWVVYVICFANTFTNILFPNWYFQGIQKMRVVTFIQLGLKILSLPFIFLIIRSVDDTWKFALIATVTNVGGGCVAAFIIRYAYNLHIRYIPFKEVKLWYIDSLPFFWSNTMNTIKQQSTVVIIGSFFSMGDVALYDLANKIFTVPATLTSSINGALFPKIVSNVNKYVIKKILRYESIIGFGVIILFILFGKFVITLLGGISMIGAYPILVILGFSILTPLLVSSYCSFVFVPNKLYAQVAKNQLIAFITFFAATFVGLLFYKNIIVIPFAIFLSGIAEIIYCNIQIYRLKLL